MSTHPTRPAQEVLAGVDRASLGRRLLAHLIDLVVLLAPITAGSALIVRSDLRGWWLTLLGVVVLLAQSVAVLRRGRTLGRVVLGLRVVDDLTGSPVRPARLVRLGRPRFLSADVRNGRDPWLLRPLDGAPTQTDSSPPRGRRAAPAADEPPLDEPSATDLSPAELSLGELAPGDRSVDAPSAVAPRPAPGAEPWAAFSASSEPARGAGVSVLTEGGDRHDVEQVLLVGRSPVDPQPGPGRSVLAWPDLSRRLAKTHLMLEWTGTVLWVTDLDSLTGTAVSVPDGSRIPLAPGVRFAAGIGSVVHCGGRSLRVVAGA